MLLGRIAAARKVDVSRDRRMIAIVTSSLALLPLYISRWMTSNVKYVSILANQKWESAPSMG